MLTQFCITQFFKKVMTLQKKLLLTFDYELFLGSRSGAVDDCLIAPTTRLMEIAARYPLKMIFFVDTTYLARLAEQGKITPRCAADHRKIVGQLQDLVKAGHYLFPHLHPHWLDAVYLPEINEWRLDNPRFYRLHGVEEQERRRLFAESYSLLEEIVRSAGGTYPFDAYRAGGWSLQPFDVMAPLFREFGVRYDFSVAPRRWSFTEAHWFDFTPVQEASGSYRFSEDVTKPDAAGEFTEFPISFLETGNWSRRLDLALRKTLYRRFLKPSGNGEILQARPLPHDPTNYPDLYYLQLASPENFKTPFMPEYFGFIKENSYLHFISHPKLLSAENLFWLGMILGHLYRNYEVESDYRMIKQF